jgi:hypothetical protein
MIITQGSTTITKAAETALWRDPGANGASEKKKDARV